MIPSVVPIPALDRTVTHAMFVLLDRCFVGVTPAQFERDLGEKTDAVLLRNDDGRLCGFSTYRIDRDVDPDGRPVTIVSSGDTIVSPDAPVGSTLERAWVNAVRAHHPEPSGRGLYWLLIVSGFRTYRFLPVFLRSFHPRYDHPEPAALRVWRHRLAAARWSAAFDPEDEIVRFAQPQRLRGSLATIPAPRRTDPHVAYFLERNPGHARGDELVCLGELSDENLNAAGRRMLDAGRRRTPVRPSS